VRILHVLTAADADGGYGGPLSVAAAQADQLRSRGHSVEIVSTHLGRSPRHDIDGLRTFPSRTLIRRFPFSSRISRPLESHLEARLGAVDLVHVHFARDIVPIRSLFRAARRVVPTVAQPHGMFTADGRLLTGVVDGVFARRAVATSRLQIALNVWERDRLIEVGVSQATVRIIPNAAPAPRLTARNGDAARRVVFISRLHPRKRVLDFAAMSALLIDGKKVSEDVCFDIYGPDAGDLQKLMSFLQSCSRTVRDRVLYCGVLSPPEVSSVLSAATLFVLPSRDEPFPVALLEAMSAGVPTICTDTCHIADMIITDRAGLVVASDPQALAEAAQRVLGDQNIAQQLVRSGYRMVTTRLSPEVVGEQLEAVYEEALLR
jgi:glycosyltransferase involved in cell wall biosynthesis